MPNLSHNYVAKEPILGSPRSLYKIGNCENSAQLHAILACNLQCDKRTTCILSSQQEA